MPGAAASIARAVEVAHRAGTLVVLTAGDPGLVRRNRPQLLEALRQGADVLFTNRSASAPGLLPHGVYLRIASCVQPVLVRALMSTGTAISGHRQTCLVVAAIQVAIHPRAGRRRRLC